MRGTGTARHARSRALRIERACIALDALQPGEWEDVRTNCREFIQLHRAFLVSQGHLINYAHHRGMCRSHGGHDCDCGKDALVEAATAHMKGLV